MFPYTFETVTAITLTVIGLILMMYFIVLKRKGWLTENSSESNSPLYICPNQECRKVFKEPGVLNDLSQNPPRKYSGCPHCGFDMKTPSSSLIEKKGTLTPKTIQDTKEPLAPAKASKPEKPIESKKTKEEPTAVKDIKKPQPAPKNTIHGRPPACSHFFGYLRKIPRNSPMPDECFSCTKMVECISYNILE